jgi:hypothetical protein
MRFKRKVAIACAACKFDLLQRLESGASGGKREESQQRGFASAANTRHVPLTYLPRNINPLSHPTFINNTRRYSTPTAAALFQHHLTPRVS